MNQQKIFGWVACMFAFPILGFSQATPTASTFGTLQLGGGYTYVSPDYGRSADKGPSFYATFDFKQHLGIEADIHYASVIVPSDIGENTYLIGPRYVIRRGRLMPYGKVLAGIGQIEFQFDNVPHSKQTKFAYALGAGLDYRLTRRINARIIDFEYQQWPGFPPNGLSPYAITIGAAYVFH